MYRVETENVLWSRDVPFAPFLGKNLTHMIQEGLDPIRPVYKGERIIITHIRFPLSIIVPKILAIPFSVPKRVFGKSSKLGESVFYWYSIKTGHSGRG
jgi:hypothetical protein